MTTQYAFYFDASACSGCKACQVACKDKHDLEVGRLWRKVYEVSGGDWVQVGDSWIPNIYAYNLSVSCCHCVDPICVDVCPAAAITKREDGIVLIDEDQCIGCRYCEWACPYGSPQYDDASGKVTKCTGCFDLVDAGEKPACVDACPMRALDFGEIGEMEAKYGKVGATYEVAEVYPLPDSSLTLPALIIKPHKDSVRAANEPAVISNKEEV